MRRTQEQYNRDGSKALPDPYEGTLDFPDWSTWRLDARLSDLLESRMVPHNLDRRAQIEREIAHVSFELMYGYEQNGERRQTNG